MRATATVVALALSALPSVSAAWCRSRSGSGQPDPMVCPAGGAFLGWSERCAGYSLDPRVLPADLGLETFRALADTAARAWQAAGCDPASGAPPAFVLAALGDSTEPVGYLPGQRNVNTVTFRDHWGDDAHHPAGLTAITVVTYDPATGQILDADTEINLRSPANPGGFVFSTSGEPGTVDLPTVLAHEFGHTQGLAHSADGSAVMWYSAGRSFPQRALTPDDAAAVCAAYPPVPPSTPGSTPGSTCDPAAASAPRAAPAASTGCGVSPAGRGTPRCVLLALALALVTAGRVGRSRRRGQA